MMYSPTHQKKKHTIKANYFKDKISALLVLSCDMKVCTEVMKHISHSRNVESTKKRKF